MTDQNKPAFWIEDDGPRLPRIALMGEFSAGKSTLANMMIGTNPLPVQVVATQLPPVWISYGDKPSVIVDLEGNQTPCDLETLSDIEPEEVAFIRFYCEQEILKSCEIIDMPGISDPNMDSAVWERIMPFADGILWCSPATQAWRRSEAAVWEEMEERVRAHSLLVLTRADMLHSEQDRSKVMRRVKSEAGTLFADILLISLALARDAEDDEELWAQSGADAFVARFLELLSTLAEGIDGAAPMQMPLGQTEVPTAQAAKEEPVTGGVVPRRPVPLRRTSRDASQDTSSEPNPLSFMPKFS